jgi:hypothetical protein
MRQQEWRYQVAHKSWALAREHNPFADNMGSIVGSKNLRTVMIIQTAKI